MKNTKKIYILKNTKNIVVVKYMVIYIIISYTQKFYTLYIHTYQSRS